MSKIKETKKAMFIKTDGKSLIVEPLNGQTFTLSELQNYVDGYIEIVYLSDKTIMVVNEEGKCIGLPVNELVTSIFPQLNDIIVGNVIVCQKDMVE